MVLGCGHSRKTIKGIGEAIPRAAKYKSFEDGGWVSADVGGKGGGG
jgi:hypothetical protein